MFKQFAAWSCNGSSVAPLTDYINNPVYQELIDEDDYFEVKSDEMKYLDLRAISCYMKEAEKLEKIKNDSKINLHILLKAAATKKLRLRVWVHSLDEYLYILTKNGLRLRRRTYTINQTNEDLLE